MKCQEKALKLFSPLTIVVNECFFPGNKMHIRDEERRVIVKVISAMLIRSGSGVGTLMFEAYRQARSESNDLLRSGMLELLDSVREHYTQQPCDVDLVVKAN